MCIRDRGKDCLLEPVLTPDEATRDPHLRSRGVFFEIDTPKGSLPQFRTPVTPRDRTFTAPVAAGADTRTVLREAGIEADRIDQLIATKAAFQS